MPDRAGSAVAQRLAERVRFALLAVPAVVLLLDLPTMLSDASDYRPFWLEAAAYAGLVVVTGLAVPMVVRRAPWGRWRWPLLTAAVIAQTASTAAVAPRDLFGTAHWSWDILGWWAVLLLLDRPLRDLLLVLALHAAITLGQVVLAGRADRPTLVGMGVSSIALGGLPIAVWLVGAAADRAAAIATRTAVETERARTAEQVAAQLHDDRQARYADLSTSAGPLLTRLADGEIDPGDPAVQQAFFVEAARIRRLFAEADDSDDPLTHELTACADTAMRRGIAVAVAVRGRCPLLPAAVRRGITEAVLHALAVARSGARVTVISVPGRVTVTVVADVTQPPEDADVTQPPEDADVTQPPGDEPGASVTGDGLVVTRELRGGSLWMEATCPTPSRGEPAPAAPVPPPVSGLPQGAP